MTRPGHYLHSSHWGTFLARYRDGRLEVAPFPEDPNPNRLIENLTDALRHPARVAAPMVRRGWLENGPGPDSRRGGDKFVKLTWDEALDLLAKELERIRQSHGPQAIFGGSYGWSSAGRFHHAQSQVHRFLNTTLGGYVKSVNTYSAGASSVILPHVMADGDLVSRRGITWNKIVAHTDLLLAFGGISPKNYQVSSGGISHHTERDDMRKAAERGCRFVLLSPQRNELPPESGFEWVPTNPASDTAAMLAMAYTLVKENLHDADFIARYCDGWEVFRQYLLGESDGVPKSPEWAQPLTGISAAKLGELARSAVGKRVAVVASHSLQRSVYGEQPIWMAAVLAALLGQHGLPGGGFAYALGSIAHYGRRIAVAPPGSLPQGANGVRDFIPVARIADMLLKPGQTYPYNGEDRRYPHIKLAYWAGGNPFHHHQDLKRLSRAFQQLDTFVVHETAWTATARHADFVLPATMSLERNDIGGSATEPLIIAMRAVAPAHGQARNDFDIFADLARRISDDAWEAFTEKRSERQWLELLYEQSRSKLEAMGEPAPAFDEFWEAGYVRTPATPDTGGVMAAFREDPEGHPLGTPSGKIQLSSEKIASFGYADCPGHPAWLPPTFGPDERHPLWLIANQPADKLHSQLDFGAFSQSKKRKGRAVFTMHSRAAAQRGIREGDCVRIFNDVGACLAVASLSADMLEHVTQLSTGAWYNPVVDDQGRHFCAHGNPNVLTRDVGTSSLAQGCAGQLSAVQVERYDGDLPPITCFDPPPGT